MSLRLGNQVEPNIDPGAFRVQIGVGGDCCSGLFWRIVVETCVSYALSISLEARIIEASRPRILKLMPLIGFYSFLGIYVAGSLSQQKVPDEVGL